ncbi:Bax inhibitor-1/YccA family protein [Gulosibacter sp. 10]|uniref:Bax inhibitor-1/YccA family protein n=1 Tax=Gulosibacter sp. 10 TaxID=1255570 RepID=UPI00097EAC34|nr:Bax inhibitor-1/YccA family protein [Gulosibacter sp. 10]SJM71507.1 membrane protein [Gulosibacter sp. 10]
MASSALQRNPYFNGQAAQQRQPAAASPYGAPTNQYGQQFGQPQFDQPGNGQAQQQYGYGQPQYQQQPSPQGLDHQYNLPSPSADQMGRMTIEDTIGKGALLFGLLFVTAAVAWFSGPSVGMMLGFAGAIAGLVLGIVLAFKKEPSVPLIVAFTLAEGLLVGGLSVMLEQGLGLNGIAMQAALGTLIVVGVTLALFRVGKVRTTPKLTKFFLVAGLSYLAFSIVNVILGVTGINTDPWGLRTGVEIFGIPLGVLLGVFAVVMGAYMLIGDFEYIENGVRSGAPRKYGWIGAYAVVATVVFIYVELLRLIAILRGSD